jgi:hypothetical protein
MLYAKGPIAAISEKVLWGDFIVVAPLCSLIALIHT